MHVQRLTIENIRTLRRFELDLSREENRAGWHVLLGDNGTGKSTVVRALALALMGEWNAHATRQDWSRWISVGSKSGHVTVELVEHEQDRWKVGGRIRRGPINAKATLEFAAEESSRNGHQAAPRFSDISAERSVWSDLEGWFSASFGPFRRFTGGDREMDKLLLSHRRLAPHLSVFSENVALGESLRWLTNLRAKSLEGDEVAAEILEDVTSFIDDTELLPHGAHIARVTSERVEILDGRGTRIDIEDMSDGYRSILSLTFELMRLIFSMFGAETARNALNPVTGTIALPGVVAIDEVDAHLHPAWQQRIGDWFVERFPVTQFFVTTHSPIICRAARRGSVWLLPVPNSEERPRRILGQDLNRLIDGNVLDAYGTDLFGEEVTRSEHSKKRLERLAHLNRKRLKAPLLPNEQRDLERLRASMPSNPSSTADDRNVERGHQEQ